MKYRQPGPVTPCAMSITNDTADGRGVGLTPSTPSSAEVLERVELYLYSP